MPEWSAEFSVDEQLARELVSRFLVPASLRPLAESWDNAVWLVDERWVFRFPRCVIALPGIRNEIAVLGELSLPLPIPVPRFVGDDPWPFFGAAFIPGRRAGRRGDRPLRRSGGRWASSCVRCTRRTSLTELPADPFGRADMALRVPKTLEALAAIGADVPPRRCSKRAICRRPSRAASSTATCTSVTC